MTKAHDRISLIFISKVENRLDAVCMTYSSTYLCEYYRVIHGKVSYIKTMFEQVLLNFKIGYGFQHVRNFLFNKSLRAYKVKLFHNIKRVIWYRS